MPVDKPLRFVVLVGSLRRGSFNAAIARALPALAPSGVTIVPLGSVGEFPLFNQDAQGQGFPPAIVAMGEAIAKADGVISNCSRPGAGFGHATHGIGRPSRVRRIASMARIDLRRAVSTTDLMSA